MRHRPLLVAAAATATLLLGACSGSGDSGIEPLATASTDADGLTAEQREVVDAVDAYQAALIDYQKGDRDIDLTQFATEELASGIADGVEQSLDDEDRQLIGETSVMTADTVSIDGDTATWKGCNDSTGLFVVPEGDDAPGVGSQRFEAERTVYTLVRQDGAWMVSDATSEDTPC